MQTIDEEKEQDDQHWNIGDFVWYKYKKNKAMMRQMV